MLNKEQTKLQNIERLFLFYDKSQFAVLGSSLVTIIVSTVLNNLYYQVDKHFRSHTREKNAE